jgi:hypothetical protein
MWTVFEEPLGDEFVGLAAADAERPGCLLDGEEEEDRPFAMGGGALPRWPCRRRMQILPIVTLRPLAARRHVDNDGIKSLFVL